MGRKDDLEMDEETEIEAKLESSKETGIDMEGVTYVNMGNTRGETLCGYMGALLIKITAIPSTYLEAAIAERSINMGLATPSIDMGKLHHQLLLQQLHH